MQPRLPDTLCRPSSFPVPTRTLGAGEGHGRGRGGIGRGGEGQGRERPSQGAIRAAASCADRT